MHTLSYSCGPLGNSAANAMGEHVPKTNPFSRAPTGFPVNLLLSFKLTFLIQLSNQPSKVAPDILKVDLASWVIDLGVSSILPSDPAASRVQCTAHC